jgi:HNH endonuclease
MSDRQVPISLQRRVRLRAGDRCEYCRLAQAGQEATFHVDHVVPRVAGGVTALENLALACVSCSLRKGARSLAIDPATGAATQLFHPRLHVWSDHFGADASGEILGLTAVGRGTVAALSMNRVLAVKIRHGEHSRDRWP